MRCIFVFCGRCTSIGIWASASLTHFFIVDYVSSSQSLQIHKGTRTSVAGIPNVISQTDGQTIDHELRKPYINLFFKHSDVLFHTLIYSDFLAHKALIKVFFIFGSLDTSLFNVELERGNPHACSYLSWCSGCTS